MVKMERKRLKPIGYLVLAIIFLNLILFAFRITNWIAFWGIIIAGAIFAYKVMPWLKKR